MTEVYLNSKYVGEIEDGRQFWEHLIDERRKGVLDKTLNAHYNQESDTVEIESLEGRAQRPLIIIKGGKPLLTEKHIQQIEKGEINWSDLVDQGVIEYLDAAEEENALVAYDESVLTKNHTHMEILPAAMCGLTTCLVPYGNFCPGARLSVGSKNQKQALGFYAANFHIRMDMDVNLLYQPQFPIVKTMAHELMNYDKHPSGQNIVVAIMSYEGYNMDDAVILNKASVERGLQRSAYYRPSVSEELRYSGGLVDEIGIPDKDVKGYKSEEDYKMLEDDGIIHPEAKVSEGDVVIGKTSPPRFLSSLEEYNLAAATRRENSVELKHGEKGVVDFVTVSENKEGNKLVQVRIRDERTPEIGDKFTSRHGQKGIVGLIVPQIDIPFSVNGIIPDLIFSPHAIPSRMTVSHMVELVGGKVGALAGRHIDGTIFDAEPIEDLRKELLRLGFRENSTETFINGKTGKIMKAKIFVGCMYYFKLKHMVANKIHARARGPIQLLTRQPTEGRAKEGGLRLGEMEKDTFVAHGASLLLKERFDSDRTKLDVCENCGLVAIHDEFKNRNYCSMCGDDIEINSIEMSYAFKLLLDELKSLCLYPRLNLKAKY